MLADVVPEESRITTLPPVEPKETTNKVRFLTICITTTTLRPSIFNYVNLELLSEEC